MSAAPGFLTDEQRKLMRSVSHGRDVILEEKKVVRTGSHGSSDKHTKSGAKLVSVGSGEAKQDRHSHSGKNGKPKKGEILLDRFLSFTFNMGHSVCSHTY